MVKKVDENIEDLAELLLKLNKNGLYFNNGNEHNYLKIALNPEWERNKNLLFKYSIAPMNNKPLGFSFHNKDQSNISNVFVYDWVTIINFNEPDKRQYSIHIIRNNKDCYENLDYVKIKVFGF